MAKTKTEMSALIGANLPANTAGLITLAAGQTFAVQIMRDSAGSSFGGVYPQAATVTAWGTAPSALPVISRLEAA